MPPKNTKSKYTVPKGAALVDKIIPCDDQAVLLKVQGMKPPTDSLLPLLEGHINDNIKTEFGKLTHQWPYELRKFAEQYIAHIYIVKNLGTSGLCVDVDYPSFDVFVDESVLSKNANFWFDECENKSVDWTIGGYSTAHIVETDQENTPSRTLENILIHEIGHCVGVVYNVTSDFSRTNIPKRSQNLNPFFEGCFNVSYLELSKTYKYAKQFQGLDYYRTKKKIQPSEYLTMVDSLQTSPFPTLYATNNDFEFFAEYFYSYVHCVLQKKPFAYRFYKNKTLVKTVPNGILNHLATPKLDYIKLLFEVMALDYSKTENQ